MKTWKNILLGACMLGTVCSLTGCGGEKWEYAEDEGVSVSNKNCSDIVSDKAKENIREKLEDKYKDVKPKVNEESVKGLLKEKITLEKDDDYYFAESVRAEELDSIFEVNGHTAEAYVDVSVYPDEEFMEYEMYAEYDGDTYCFAEVDFISPEYYAKKEAEEQKQRKEEAEKKRKEEEAEQKRKEEEEKLIEAKIGDYKYKDMVDEDNYCGNYTIKELKKVFKNATLTVTEDYIKLIDYKFPIELNPYGDSLSEETNIVELDNIFKGSGTYNLKGSGKYSLKCIVKTDETVCVEINYSPSNTSHLITLTFVKQ